MNHRRNTRALVGDELNGRSSSRNLHDLSDDATGVAHGHSARETGRRTFVDSDSTRPGIGGITDNAGGGRGQAVRGLKIKQGLQALGCLLGLRKLGNLSSQLGILLSKL